MAVNNDPVFAKTPKHSAAAVSAANFFRNYGH